MLLWHYDMQQALPDWGGLMLMRRPIDSLVSSFPKVTGAVETSAPIAWHTEPWRLHRDVWTICLAVLIHCSHRVSIAMLAEFCVVIRGRNGSAAVAATQRAALIESHRLLPMQHCSARIWYYCVIIDQSGINFAYRLRVRGGA